MTWIRFYLITGQHFDLEWEEGSKLLDAFITRNYETRMPLYQWRSKWTDPNTSSIGISLDAIICWVPVRGESRTKCYPALDIEGS